jgi:hypothetical protein
MFFWRLALRVRAIAVRFAMFNLCANFTLRRNGVAVEKC